MNSVVPAEEPVPSRGRWIAFLVAAAFFMENLDATVITTAIPAMAQSFGVAHAPHHPAV